MGRSREKVMDRIAWHNTKTINSTDRKHQRSSSVMQNVCAMTATHKSGYNKHTAWRGYELGLSWICWSSLRSHVGEWLRSARPVWLVGGICIRRRSVLWNLGTDIHERLFGTYLPLHNYYWHFVEHKFLTLVISHLKDLLKKKKPKTITTAIQLRCTVRTSLFQTTINAKNRHCIISLWSNFVNLQKMFMFRGLYMKG